MHKLFFIVCYCFLFISLEVNSQYKKLTFSHITDKENLPFKHLFHSILQDLKGFIWFGSEIGLHRFDGYEFTNYYFDPNNINSIHGQVVKSLMEDDQKQIWIATNTGVNVYNWEKDSFCRIPFVNEVDTNITFTDNYVYCIIQTRDKNIYVSI